MAIHFYARAVAPVIAIISLLDCALAQTGTLPTIVVTATRSPLEISRAGSAITVVEAAEIEKAGARGVADALRAVPGLDVRERGGVGAVTGLALRGSTPGQTLVLIDGVRIGDPTGTDGALDFGSLAVLDIERIEVLRGPQSALYGSDAMGGVVNIITRRGGPLRRTALVEGGSYGTLRARGAVSGSVDRFDYAFATEILHSNGFARYVDRAAQRAGAWPPVPRSDPTDRVGVALRVGYRGDGFDVEAGAQGHFNRAKTDNPFAFAPANVYSPFNQARQWTGVAFTRGSFDALDGALKNRITLSHTSIDRSSSDTESCPDFFSDCKTRFRGERSAAEYQGDLKLGAFGLLTFGARTETETAKTAQDFPAGYAGPPFDAISARQTTNSAFALHQTSVGDMDVSLGGRVDAVAGGKTFPTWRATWAWRLPDIGAKLRASAGTGARNPSLFQRFSSFGTPALRPETNAGFDAGVDQSLFGGRMTLSATAFHNRYRDLIDFRFFGCAPGQFFGCYFNVGRATTYGVELAAETILVPETWRARASYTHLVAKDDATGAKLLQRPRDKGVVSIFYAGVPKLDLEARLTLVGSKLDFGPVKLAPYAKFDLFADYRLNDALTLFGRIENIGGARYEEVFNYQVAGRSFHAGIRGTW